LNRGVDFAGQAGLTGVTRDPRDVGFPQISTAGLFSIGRTWMVRGSSLEFRWEVFNLFNRVNFDLPNRTFGTPDVGRIFSAKSPRECNSAFVSHSDVTRI
jgi:hypothetical protein